MIGFNEILRIVLNNMFEKKKRVFLTIAGIVIGIFTFTIFIFLSQGLSNAITEQFTSFGVSVLNVQSANRGGGGPPVGEGLDDTDVERIKQVITDFNYVAPNIFYSGLGEFDRERSSVLALAYQDENYAEVMRDIGLEVEQGRNLRPGDSGVIVVGAKIARDEFEKEITLGSVLEIDETKFRVIGIVKERGDLFVDSSILMPFDDIQELSGQDTFSNIRVSFLETADLEANKEAIERKLNPNGEEQRVTVSSAQQAVDQFNEILGVLTIIISFISGVALVVGGINVMNTMYSNVLERINEISVLKAIGATNHDIRNLFLVESGILGIVGSLIGFFMAYGLAELLSYLIINFASFNVQVYFDSTLFVAVIFLTAFFAMLFGTYPAIRAASVNPADNLRDE